MYIYISTYVHLWHYLAQFFLKWEIFHTKDAEKIKTHFTFNNFFTKMFPFMGYCRQLWYSQTGQTLKYNTVQKKDPLCSPDN